MPSNFARPLQPAALSGNRPAILFPPQKIKGSVIGHICTDRIYTLPSKDPHFKLPGKPAEFLVTTEWLKGTAGLTPDQVIHNIPKSARQSPIIRKGGPAASAAQAIHQFDPNTQVTFVGYRGNDHLGKWLLEHFKKHGMAANRLMIGHGTPTGFTLVRELQSKPPLRNFILEIGANRALTANSLQDSDFKIDFFHIGGNFLCPNLNLVEVCKTAHSKGVPFISLDTVADPLDQWRLPELADQLDLLMMDLQEAQKISGQQEPENILEHFRGLGYPAVVIKMGAEGSYGYAANSRLLYDRPGVFRMPISRLIQCLPDENKSPTGTGDIYSGVLVDCIARGLNLPTAMAMATAAAGFKLLNKGGELGPPLKNDERDRYLRGIIYIYNSLIRQPDVEKAVGILPEFFLSERMPGLPKEQFEN